ncbi:sodium:solute symporter family transporter [Pedobacter ghigonis]|uniref:sodium:solute symporter family transporter n=1 Tax=Pedobacter ghigonis TaxID=2730403 RepID=UPI000F8FE717|nr:sodium/solute symporter [Pedobacter ghigonis]
MDVSLALIDYVVLLGYLMMLLFVAFYLGQKKKNATDIFLGGRSLTWWQIGFSLFSANAGPMMLIGFASIGFTKGVVGSNFEWLAWIFLLLLAMVFVPHYLTTKVSTMPQFLMVRYGKRSYNFLTIYSLVSIMVVWLGSGLYAGGLLISQIFNWPLFKAMVLVAIIATSFTTLGGLKAVVRTGVFQSIIIIISSIVLTVLAINKIGGISQLVNATPSSYWHLFQPAKDPEYSWVAIVLGYPVVAIYYWCTDQTIVQKVLAAKDIKEGQYGAVFISVLKIIMPFIFIFPGIMCFVLYKDIAKPDNAYITLVKQLMPPGLMGLCIAALIAALIDTISSGLNSFSTVFTLDVVNQYKKLSEKQNRLVGRLVTVLAAVMALLIATLYSYSGKGFFDLSQGLVSILAPPLSVVFLMGVLWKKANNKAAEAVLYGGGLLCIVLGLCHILNYPYKGYWPHFLLLSFYIFLALSVIMVLVSLFTKNTHEHPLLSIAETNRQFKYKSTRVWVLWAILAVVMIGIYIIFN